MDGGSADHAGAVICRDCGRPRGDEPLAASGYPHDPHSPGRSYQTAATRFRLAWSPAMAGSYSAFIVGIGNRRTQVLLALSPCSRVIRERRNTLLKRSWQAEDTCSISVELTRRIVTLPLARIEAVLFAPRT